MSIGNTYIRSTFVDQKYPVHWELGFPSRIDRQTYRALTSRLIDGISLGANSVKTGNVFGLVLSHFLLDPPVHPNPPPSPVSSPGC